MDNIIIKIPGQSDTEVPRDAFAQLVRAAYHSLRVKKSEQNGVLRGVDRIAFSHAIDLQVLLRED